MTALAEARLRRRTRPVSGRDPRWVWLIPIGTFLFVGIAPLFGFTRVAAGVFGVALIAVLSRWPGPALVALVWFLPLQIPGFSFLYHHGVPGPLVRPFGALKEVLALAVLVAAIRAIRNGRSHLDAVDKLLLTYVGLLVVYLVLPMIVSSAEFYPRNLSTRLLGFRINAGFIVLFVAARHAPISERWRRRFVASVLGVAGFIAALGVYQFAQPDAFRDVLVNDIGLPFYQFEVLKTPVEGLVQLYRWTSASPVRVGSLFVGPFTFADFMLLPTGFLLGRLVRRSARPRDIALLTVTAGALLASQTRANILALAAMALLAMAPRRGSATNQLRIAAIVLVAAVAFVPNLASSRLGGTGAAGSSTEGHLNEIRFGLEVLQEYPLGLGLGSAPNAAVRDENVPVIISDNSLLQVGNELGVGMMVLFTVILVVVILRLGRAARDDPDNDLAAAARLTLIGLVIAGQLHHVFQAFAIAWLAWAAAGLGLPPAGLRREGEEYGAEVERARTYRSGETVT